MPSRCHNRKLEPWHGCQPLSKDIDQLRCVQTGVRFVFCKATEVHTPRGPLVSTPDLEAAAANSILP
ncbi:MAG: hypothetical protein IPK82_23955 [Polyangiaceae bacterium]|nr:hypothetical protein [Polyangiaceae bacterium]